jgi:hypothetical protein
MGKLIRWNGDTSDVQPLNGTDYQLDELKKFVDGYIEIVNLNERFIMVVNEEGMRDKPVNKLATLLAISYGRYFATIYG